jgi:LysM repeat protein
MPKNKHQANIGGHQKHHKHKQMEKVKIKRTKRTHKKISTKEKILGGLGLGSTLIGGVGAISASQPQTQFVRTNETESGSSNSKIKSALNKVFGIKTAQGAITAEQEAARQMLATGLNPDGSPATQEQLTQANQTYYGGYYNQLPNVGGNYTPEELQNIGAEGLAGAHVIRDGQGNFMGAVNRVGDTVVVTTSNGSSFTFSLAEAQARMQIAANDSIKNLLIQSRDDGYLATIGVVASTGGGTSGGTTGDTSSGGTVTNNVQVTGVVSIFDENGNETARQGNYGGNRYAVAGGILYDGNGQPVTNLSENIVNQIISQINSQNPGFAIITDANGNPLSVWDAQGQQIIGTTAESILNSYHTGTQLHFSAPSVPGGSVGTQTPPTTPPVVNPLDSISSTTVQVTPGQYGQSWSTEGVTQAYNQALGPFQLVTQKNNQTGQVVNYTITLRDGTSKTFTPTELNNFLNTTWNGGQFMNLSSQDQQIFVAAIQARLQDPNIGLGIPNLPSPNTNDAQAIHFIDSNGNLINFQQGFSPTGQSFRADAEWVQRMFPGSRIVDAGFPGGTTSSWNPVDSGDPRGYYQLVLPNGESFNIGLFLQGNLEQSNGKTIVTITQEQAKYFTAPTNNFIASVIGTATGGSTTTGTTGGTGGGTTTNTTTGGQITTASLPGGTVGVSYNQGLSAYNASTTVRSWAISSGQLPAGLSINSNTGFIYGFPTQAGNYNFTATVTFSNNQTASKVFNITINTNSTTTAGTTANLNAWVSETAASVRVGESKTINAHVADGDAVLVGANNFTATSSNTSVATVSVASDSNSVVITGRSVGTTNIRIHPSGRADAAGDRLIMVTVTAAGTTTTVTTGGNNNSSIYPTPSSSGGGGNAGIVTGTIFNGSGSGYTNLPDNTGGNDSNTGGQINLVRSSVSDVGDDEGPGESADVSSGATTVRDSISNVGDDEDVEANEVTDSTVTDTDAEIEYNEVEGSSDVGNTGNNNSNTQTVTNLQQQVGQLQGRINSLNSQIASAQSSGSGSTNIQPYLEQINQLQQQVNSLNATISRLQSGSGVRVFNNSTGLLQYADIVPKNQVAGEADSSGTYTVKKGDSLWKISQKYYGTGTKWRNILEANPQSLSRPGNVRTLRIGYVLTIPSLTGQTAGQSTVKTYEAQPTQSQAKTETSIKTFERNGTQQNSDAQLTNITQTQSTGQNSMQTVSGLNTRGNSQSQTQNVVYKDSVSEVKGDDEEVELKE